MFVQCLAQRDPATAPAPRCYGNTHDAATPVSYVLASILPLPSLSAFGSGMSCMRMTPDSSLSLGPIFVQEPQSMAVPAVSMLRTLSYTRRFAAEFRPLSLKQSLKALRLPASVSFFILTASLASCKDGKCL